MLSYMKNSLLQKHDLIRGSEEASCDSTEQANHQAFYLSAHPSQSSPALAADVIVNTQ